MQLNELEQAVGNGDIDTVVVGFTDHFGRLMGKRFDAGFFLADAVDHGTHGCDYLLAVDIDMEPVPGYSYASWERGYGDFHLVPDITTLRRAGWAEHTAIVLCDVFDPDGQLVPVAPRSILRRQIDRASAMGLTAKAASELEFFVYEDSYRVAHQKGYRGLDSSGWYNEDYNLLQGARGEPFVRAARNALSASEIPVENSKGEAAVGQHELNIRYAGILDMADRHALMKQGLKELADARDVSVSFMAKPIGDQSGSSCHVHLSLWDSDDTNRFVAEDGNRSETFRWFLAGWMERVRDVMPFYGPTVNSYKRFVEQSWAPTRIAWSDDNRTAGFRVVGGESALRIECRIPGADANPYLMFAAALASGLDGIEHRTEPPPRFDGDVYSDQVAPTVPATLREATTGFSESTFSRSAFGDEVVDHYAHFFESELSAFDRAVTDWELSRYFERI